MTRHCEFRLAKRNGEIVQQRRYVTATVRVTTPWWKFWEHNFDIDTVYGEWADVPMPEIGVYNEDKTNSTTN